MTRCLVRVCAIAAAAALLPASAGAAPARNGPLFSISYELVGSGPRVIRTLLFISATGRIERRRRVSNAWGEITPSPDGRRIAFTVGNDVWIADANLRHRHRVARHGGRVAWSPDGERLALVVGTRLVLMRSDGHGVRSVARVGRMTWPLVWASNARSIAFVRERRRPAGCRGSSEVVAVPTRGGRARRLYTPGFRCGAVGWFDWSPDGRRLVAEVFEDTNHKTPRDPRAAADVGIDVTRTHGHAARRIALNGFYPAWSPDGRAIAFMVSECPALPPSRFRCLRTVRPDGSRMRTVAPILNETGQYSPVDWLR